MIIRMHVIGCFHFRGEECNMLIDFYATYVLLRHPFLYYLLRHYYAVFLYCLVLDLGVSFG